MAVGPWKGARKGMKKIGRRTLWELFKLGDIAAIFACFMGALTFDWGEGNLLSGGIMPAASVEVIDVLWIFMLSLVWHFIFVAFGLYHNRRFSSLKAEAKDIIKASVVCLLVYALATMFYSRIPASLRFLLSFWLLTIVVMLGIRVVLRIGLRFLRLHNRNIRFLLVVGTNERARRFARTILKERELGYRLVGFVDDSWHGEQPGDTDDRFRIVASLNGVFEYLRHNVVDEVFIALPIKSHYHWIDKLLGACSEHGVAVHYTTNFFDCSVGRQGTDNIGDTDIIYHVVGSMGSWGLAVKRGLDIVSSAILLAAFAPIMLVVALVIKLTSKGPIIYAQKRIGLNKRVFEMYKFRTMVPHAERMQNDLEKLNEASGPVFKIRNDPRVTPVGRWLRKTSLDELPQLINVLKGDMSLVGPRPLPLRDYKGFDNDRFRRRLSVPPGITCIWQANGRSDV
ncbi:MAG: exopolysaccharide biosynthesis polyprenyl glycosylphosphotransferase, partial [Chitinivibrionales bacterium]|nr:exopolysaccharide biosynthesis polyprenyl glycosylphosphotransferase [Chitinivibrionales bacterium]MBD3357872.1 exopolysaccharide biosynthesis polyprenyl glycosylphosphotransferase [Chitinivibrionales bacterium]